MKKGLSIISSPIFLIGAGIFALVFMLGTVKKLFSSMFSSLNDEKERAENLLGQITVNGKLLSKSLVELANRADLAYQAMWNSFTDEELLFNQVNGLNTEDLKQFVKAFGNRKDTVFGFTIFEGSFVNWVYAELSGSDLEKMLGIFKNTGVFPTK